jgi:hypothetical protein
LILINAGGNYSQALNKQQYGGLVITKKRGRVAELVEIPWRRSLGM